MTELSAKMLEVANSKLGEKELTGHNDGRFVEFIQNWLDAGAGWMEKQPWCACFATWCLYQAAAQLQVKPQLPKCGSSTDLYAFGAKHSLLLERPEPGCIGLMKSDGSDGKTHHHTFMVESVEGDHVHGIDGNWQNAVSKTFHAIADCDWLKVC